MSTLNNSLAKTPEAMPQQPKKFYQKPKLEVLGDVRSVTLGGSPGLGESGGTKKKMN
jgi:hypothetical protein